MKWLAATRMIRMGSAIQWAVGACAAVLAFGFWAGQRWESGQNARTQLRAERTATASQGRQQDHIHQEAVNYEIRQGERLRWYLLSDRQLREWTDARPDLAGCDIGPDGLRHIAWWDAIGTGQVRREPADAVPYATPAAGERAATGPDGEHEGEK